MTGFESLEATDPRQIGRYRIVARLGAGGMGQVYLGRSPGGRAVAVKVIRSELAADDSFLLRFAREVKAARRVNGAFTAGVIDADLDGSPAWLATVYVPSVSLGKAVAAHGPWPQEPTLALGAGLAEALEAIHSAGVIHRDLKPSNVLLATDGPRVIDFGISVADEASALTRTGMVVGTPGFMSPEQITGGLVGPASDVFSLGAVLAFTATGAGPFGTGMAHAVNFRAVYEEADLRNLPPALRTVTAECLVKDPTQRISVSALLEQLAGAVGDRRNLARTFTESEWLPESVASTVRIRPTVLQLPNSPSASPIRQTEVKVRPVNVSTQLRKRGEVSLTEKAPDLKTVIISLDWGLGKPAGPDFNIDVSALVVGANGKVLSDQHFVFFNNRQSPEGAVEHLTVGNEHASERIKIDLTAVPAETAKIVFPVAIYDAGNRQQRFDSVGHLCIRVIDQLDGQEVAIYEFAADVSTEFAVVSSELYRTGTEWKFRAIGRGYASGLRGIALDHGVNV
ncbi:TerD family protein [Streptomyces sp. ActVer]|uniref:TerD family protein n=1 Tax=Streptomyces sp. ActVer TaxID=3014558 RepID=UPI0022B2F50F|nr:TerD family protein [Streptomyces sp. ActVer]MCZ4508167.1 TerD family protein [Streptomyces sp. ActVer]